MFQILFADAGPACFGFLLLMAAALYGVFRVYVFFCRPADHARWAEAKREKQKMTFGLLGLILRLMGGR